MKKQVFFIHGAEAFSKYDDFIAFLKTKTIRDPFATRTSLWWSDHLREELGEGFEVFTPSMPNKENAKYEEWKIWFERYFEFLRDDVVLIGWSQGGYFLSKYLIENNMPVHIKCLYLVGAPFSADLFGEPQGVQEDGGDFAFDTENVGELAKKAEKIVVIHSKDDFVVPYEHATKYVEKLPRAELVTFSDRNHFLQEDFPELVERLKAA